MTVSRGAGTRARLPSPEYAHATATAFLSFSPSSGDLTGFSPAEYPISRLGCRYHFSQSRG